MTRWKYLVCSIFYTVVQWEVSMVLLVYRGFAYRNMILVIVSKCRIWIWIAYPFSKAQTKLNGLLPCCILIMTLSRGAIIIKIQHCCGLRILCYLLIIKHCARQVLWWELPKFLSASPQKPPIVALLLVCHALSC